MSETVGIACLFLVFNGAITAAARRSLVVEAGTDGASSLPKELVDREWIKEISLPKVGIGGIDMRLSGRESSESLDIRGIEETELPKVGMGGIEVRTLRAVRDKSANGFTYDFVTLGNK